MDETLSRIIELILGFFLPVTAIIISICSLKQTKKLQKKQFDINLLDKRLDLLNFYSRLEDNYMNLITIKNQR